jgi:hypothetical protein
MEFYFEPNPGRENLAESTAAGPSNEDGLATFGEPE